MPGNVSRMSPTALATGPAEDGAAFGAGAAAGAGAASFAAGAGASAPPTSNTTSTPPTGTVSPTLKRSSVTLQALGAPMVTVALSVITSTISWFSVTSSPALTSQLTISPSATPSPISGSLNSNFAMGRFSRWDQDAVLVSGQVRRPTGARSRALRPRAIEQCWQNAVRKRHILHLEAVRERRIEAGHAHRRRFQVVEAAFDDQGYEFGAETAGPWGFMDDHEAPRVFHARDDRRNV